MLPATPMENPIPEAREMPGDGSRKGWQDRLRQWTSGTGANEEVETKLEFQMRVAETWERVAFFEEAPGRPRWILRKVERRLMGIPHRHILKSMRAGSVA